MNAAVVRTVDVTISTEALLCLHCDLDSPIGGVKNCSGTVLENVMTRRTRGSETEKTYPPADLALVACLRDGVDV